MDNYNKNLEDDCEKNQKNLKGRKTKLKDVIKDCSENIEEFHWCNILQYIRNYFYPDDKLE